MEFSWRVDAPTAATVATAVAALAGSGGLLVRKMLRVVTLGISDMSRQPLKIISV